MSTASKVGVSVAGGIIVGPGAPKVLVEGSPFSLLGDAVAGHGLPPHSSPVMVGGSGKVLAQGKPVIRDGVDSATCGHIATGSSKVQVG